MTVVVWDMKMPAGCEECPFFSYHGYYCLTTGRSIHWTLKERIEIPEWCPLEEVTEEEYRIVGVDEYESSH